MFDEFVISKEMQEFLKKPHDSVDNIADVIYYASRSLKSKLSFATQLKMN